MASVGSLEEEANKRRERLKAMREKGHNKTEGDSKKQKTEEAEAETEAALPKPVFRSYKPKDENLQVGFCRFRIRLSVRPFVRPPYIIWFKEREGYIKNFFLSENDHGTGQTG